MKISDIFREFGEDRFRKMETAFFIEKAKQAGNVFSTGGGIVLGNENRKILQNNGTTFFLNTSTVKLADRIKNNTKRPLLNDSDNLESRLKEIWEERKSFYKGSAHHTINTDNLNSEQVLDEILNLLELPLANH